MSGDAVEARGAPLGRCLFCWRRFRENGRLAHLPLGTRIAFDPVGGRLWVICPSCHRWNLCPIEERVAALHELERLAMDRGRQIAATAHVELLEADGLVLLRVGRADLEERSWWRYGRELRRKQVALQGPRSTVAAYTIGALASLGGAVGMGDPDLSIDWEDRPVIDVLRWRRFGWAAWHGRETCPFCHSTLRALRYDLGWWVYPLLGRDGRLAVGVPCQRCDPWTPEKVYTIEGEGAESTLRRLLAYQNLGAATDGRIADAVQAIDHAGSPGAFAHGLTEQRASLWRMGPAATLALEISLGETAERRMLGLELRAVEFLWRREEEIARIVDEELTPRRLLEAHLRRLPIRLSRLRAGGATGEDVEGPPAGDVPMGGEGPPPGGEDPPAAGEDPGRGSP